MVSTVVFCALTPVAHADDAVDLLRGVLLVGLVVLLQVDDARVTGHVPLQGM